MHMVHLQHRRGILGEAVHQPGETAVHGTEKVDADGEVGAVEERPVPTQAHLPDLGKRAVPSGGAGDNRHAGREGAEYVARGGIGPRELDGHIGLAESGRGGVGDVFHVDARADAVSALLSNALYHMSHAAIAYDCYFHFL